MNWICIGMIAGSLVTSLHDTEEQCEGRKAMLLKSKAQVSTKCVEMPGRAATFISNGISIVPSCTWNGNSTMSCSGN